MKKALSLLLLITLIISMCACSQIPVSDNNSKNTKLSDFYSKVSESQALLDDVADDIYNNWHGAVYDDEFDGDIDTAILVAQMNHAEDLEKIETLDAEIAELFKSVKDGNCSDLVKNIMSAYSDYYEFVVNVSGSFDSYSANLETLKKELASLLRDLSYEL